MGKEAYDDYKRNLRDREANSARYLVLALGASSPSDEEEQSHSLLQGDSPPTRSVPSSSIRVGDLVLLEKNQRVPADLILLRTSDSSGTCFIRTDQLDGETDWKLRVAVPATQKLPFDHELLNLDAEIYGASLKVDWTLTPSPVYSYSSRSRSGCAQQRYPYIHWHVYDQHAAHCVLGRGAHGPSTDDRAAFCGEHAMGEYRACCGFCYRFRGIYWAGDACSDEHESLTDQSWAIGPRNQSTRQGMSFLGMPGSARADCVRKILCAVSFVLSVVLVALNGFRGTWYIYVFRFLILFSSIIPIRWAIKVK